MIDGLLGNALQIAVFQMTKYFYISDHKLISLIYSVWDMGNNIGKGLERRRNLVKELKSFWCSWSTEWKGEVIRSATGGTNRD